MMTGKRAQVLLPDVTGHQKIWEPFSPFLQPLSPPPQPPQLHHTHTYIKHYHNAYDLNLERQKQIAQACRSLGSHSLISAPPNPNTHMLPYQDVHGVNIWAQTDVTGPPGTRGTTLPPTATPPHTHTYSITTVSIASTGTQARHHRPPGAWGSFPPPPHHTHIKHYHSAHGWYKDTGRHQRPPATWDPPHPPTHTYSITTVSIASTGSQVRHHRPPGAWDTPPPPHHHHTHTHTHGWYKDTGRHQRLPATWDPASPPPNTHTQHGALPQCPWLV